LDLAPAASVIPGVAASNPSVNTHFPYLRMEWFSFDSSLTVFESAGTGSSGDKTFENGIEWTSS
jgi:hypothetical protein